MRTRTAWRTRSHTSTTLGCVKVSKRQQREADLESTDLRLRTAVMNEFFPLSISSMSLSPMEELVEAIAQTSASMKAAKCSPDDG